MEKILLVEDEARIRNIVLDYFTAHRLSCDLARNGEEALDILGTMTTMRFCWIFSCRVWMDLPSVSLYERRAMFQSCFLPHWVARRIL